jgi:glycosyltransferase involved in cell wall biosynthesis
VVVVPNYNREAHLPNCLESIRAQTFTDWRAVVGDNASTDRSVEVVQSFADPRFQLICRPVNVGYVRNTNLLINDVDAEFVAILHSDDWWEPDFLRRLVDLLDGAPTALMAICAVKHVFDTGAVHIKSIKTSALVVDTAILPSAEATRVLVRTWPFLTPSDVLARTDLYRSFAGFEESLPYSTDWLMWLRAASVGSVGVCQQPLANNRKHASSITEGAERDVLWADEWIRLARVLAVEWQANGIPYPDATRELRAMNALRFVVKSHELHERGNRSGALKLTRLAQATAPSRTGRVGAWMQWMFIKTTTPAAARRLRHLAARLARRLPLPRQPRGTSNSRGSAFGEILTALIEND